MKFPGVVAGDRQKPRADAKNFVSTRGKLERELPPASSRLREIRMQLGLSQENFAARLDIPTATLLSYEYGRTQKVPDQVLLSAEAIYKQEREVVKRNQDFGERDMQEIIAQWAVDLGIPKEDMKTLSEVLGVSKSTVHRWIAGDMRPRPRELSGYMRAVKAMSKRMKPG